MRLTHEQEKEYLEAIKHGQVESWSEDAITNLLEEITALRKELENHTNDWKTYSKENDRIVNMLLGCIDKANLRIEKFKGIIKQFADKKQDSVWWPKEDHQKIASRALEEDQE